jgi:hypothetical protein
VNLVCAHRQLISGGSLTHSLTHSLLTYSLTHSTQHSPSPEANRFSASQEIPHIYGTRKFITAFTSARHLSLSWASSIQFISPHPTYWRSILILSSHLCLGLPSGMFHSGFPTKTQYTHLLYPLRATFATHKILLDLITQTTMAVQWVPTFVVSVLRRSQLCVESRNLPTWRYAIGYLVPEFSIQRRGCILNFRVHVSTLNCSIHSKHEHEATGLCQNVRQLSLSGTSFLYATSTS